MFWLQRNILPSCSGSSGTYCHHVQGPAEHTAIMFWAQRNILPSCSGPSATYCHCVQGPAEHTATVFRVQRNILPSCSRSSRTYCHHVQGPTEHIAIMFRVQQSKKIEVLRFMTPDTVGTAVLQKHSPMRDRLIPDDLNPYTTFSVQPHCSTFTAAVRTTNCNLTNCILHV